MRLLLVSDAWFPQVNGVVRTLDTLTQILKARGHTVHLITPDQFKTLPCPTYPDIRLALVRQKTIDQIIDDFSPDAIHISTEGPLGILVRRHCVHSGKRFTTAYHTRFPEYINARIPIPLKWLYQFMRWFHKPSGAVMVATQTIENDLKSWGFKNICRWSRGVNTELFRPRDKSFLDAQRPIFLYVGRVAVEKNIEDFLRLDLPGSKVIVGDGPQCKELKKNYPDAIFAGTKEGESLARYFASADVFVFPSKTDTFGLVLLEALASGVPVAAYPVPGPIDVISQSGVGALDDDLALAARAGLNIDAQKCRLHAMKFSWENSVNQFTKNLAIRQQAS